MEQIFLLLLADYKSRKKYPCSCRCVFFLLTFALQFFHSTFDYPKHTRLSTFAPYLLRIIQIYDCSYGYLKHLSNKSVKSAGNKISAFDLRLLTLD